MEGVVRRRHMGAKESATKIMIRQRLSTTNERILFFVTEDWYFCSHRLPLARAARDAGLDVAVVTHVDKHGTQILKEGFRLVPLNLKRNGSNLVREMLLMLSLLSIYRREKPAIVHHVAMKPIIYGTIAARLTGVPVIINAFGGLGYLFSSSKFRAVILRRLVTLGLRMVLNDSRCRIIVQNPDDLQRLAKECDVDPNRITLIKGSGVDLKQFYPSQEPIGVPLVVLASRMLWNKGIGEFVEAASILNKEGVAARFALVGESDDHNPLSIPGSRLKKWHADNRVEWWGYRTDMPSVLAQASVVCLPSYYGEGVPKILIEAAASGRPIVTTDMPGCREIVRDGENGLLVPVRNSRELARALGRLINDAPLRREMGYRGRRIVESEFSVESVVEETIQVYEEMLRA
jgi:glycosyltransferase involved in cell wall biosynthesis